MIKISAEFMLYVLIGVYAQKRNIVKDDFDSQLSNFIVKIIIPVMIVQAMQMEITMDIVRDCMWLLMLCIAILLVSAAVGQMLWRILGRGTTGRICRFACIFTNFSIVGLPIMSMLYDQKTILYFTIFVIPQRIALYTFAESLLSPSNIDVRTSRSCIWKRFFSAPIVAVIVGLLICFSGIKIPDIVNRAMSSVSVTCLPLGVILCGLVIGKHGVGKSFNKKAAVIVLARNVLMPAITLVLCRICNLETALTRVAVVGTALPVGILLTAFAAKYDMSDEAASQSAGAVILSTVAAAVTIPIWAYLIEIL